MTSSKRVDFEEKLKKIFGDQASIVIKCHSKPFSKAFRIESDFSKEEVLKKLKQENFDVKNTAFENCYYIENESKNFDLSKSTPHLNGEIYIQELSSMLPPIILKKNLNKTSNLNFLDLCAAPGSKAGQLIQLFESAKLFVNEPNRKRFIKMKSVLKKYEDKNITFLSIDGVILPIKKPEFRNFFDAILVDVPCSNEGSIRLDIAESLKYWSIKEARKISKLQKGLLNSGIKMLKPGGILVYSTCTYSVEENEAVVDWALKKWKDEIDIVKIQLPLDNTMMGFTKFAKFNFDQRLSRTLRIVPNGIAKGFYLALMKKALTTWK